MSTASRMLSITSSGIRGIKTDLEGIYSFCEDIFPEVVGQPFGNDYSGLHLPVYFYYN